LDTKSEIEAMQQIAKALDSLSEDARQRVLTWAGSVYQVQHPRAEGGAKRQALHVPEDAAQEPRATKFGSLAELFDAADPRTEWEKALVGGFWLQKNSGLATFDAASVNRELRHLGHAVSNITSAFDDLKGRKPALAVQTAKAGKTQQARKKYMITTSGESYVGRMLTGDDEESG
jgi:hypothetical protein